MGLEAMSRRQYETTSLSFPMKQVSLVTVSKQRSFDEDTDELTDFQSSPSKTLHSF